jgi:nucleotide-binding universal stress UspA family protein
VDGSTHSTNATETLIKHAALFKDAPEVFLLYVHLPVPKLHGMSMVVSQEMINKYYQEESEEALATSKRLLEKAGVESHVQMLVGPVAETIVKQAESQGCDLIYMGTRGMGGLKNVLLGSNAVKVLHLATIPVVLVR